MELIIDIPEEIYESSKRECKENDDLIIDTFTFAIGYGTPIPDNATNGDVIRAMFPNTSFHYHKASDIVDDYVSVCINDCDTQQDYSMAWWNALYQKGGKE